MGEKHLEGWQITIQGTCKYLAPGSGSVFVRLDVLEDEPLTLLFDGAAVDPKILTGVPTDIPSAVGRAPAVPQEVTFRVRFYPFSTSSFLYAVKLETWDENNSRWNAAQSLRLALPNLQAWIEGGCATLVGIANAKISAMEVKHFRAGSLFIIR